MSSAESPVPPPSPAPRPKRSWAFYVAWVIIGVAVGAVLWALAFPTQVVQTVLAQAIPVLEDATQLKWRFDHGSATVFGNTITIPEVRLLDPETDDPVATIDRLIVKLRWGPLTTREALADPDQVIRALRGISLEGMTIAASRTREGFDLVELFSDRRADDRIPPLNIQFAIRASRLEYTDYPMLASGERDWATPLKLTVGVAAEARFQEGVITNAEVQVTPVDQRDRIWWRLNGSAEFAGGFAATISPDLSIAELEDANLLSPILRMLGPTVAQSLLAVEDGRLTGQLLVSGDFAGGLPQYGGDVHLGELSIRHVLLGPEPVHGALTVTLNPVRWRLTDGRFTQGESVLALVGAIDPRDPAWPMDGSFSASNLELTRIPMELPFAESVGYQGPIFATGRIGGTLSSPTMQATLLAPRILLASAAYEMQPTPIEYANGILRLKSTLTQGASQLLLQGSVDFMAATSAFQLQAQSIDADWVRRALPDFSEIPVTGRFNAGLTVINGPDTPTLSEVSLSSSDGLIGAMAYRTLLGQVHITGETVVIDRLVGTFPGAGDGTAMVQGEWDPVRGLDLVIEGGGLSLAQFDASRTITGTVYGTAHLRGTPTAPHGEYTLQVLDGAIGGVPYRQLHQRGEISPSRIEVLESSLVFPQGSMALAGRIDLQAAEQVDLTFDLSGLDGFTLSPVTIREVEGSVRLHGPLASLQLDKHLEGTLEANGVELATIVDEASVMHIDGLGWQFPRVPDSLGDVVAQLVSGDATPKAALALTHSAEVRLYSSGLDPLVDPFLREAILEAAPTLGAWLTADAERATSPIPIEGVLRMSGAWDWDGTEAVGASTLSGAEFTVGPIVLSTLMASASRATGERVRLEGLAERFDGAAISLVGSVDPEPQWLASDLDLDVQLKDWPLSTFVALTGSGLEQQIDAKLTGGGILRGPIDALTTIAQVGDIPGHLRFLIADGRVAELTDITGLVVVGLQSGEVRVHGANLDAPDGFAVRGEGTVYLTRERFTDSRAMFDLTGLQIERLTPLLGPDAPAVSGVLEASAVYAVLGGVPGIRGQLKIAQPRIGLLELDRIGAVMDYNPFARRLTIDKATPLFFDKAGYQILSHGTVSFPKDQSPVFDLVLETPVEQEVLPMSAFLAENEFIGAEGGLEGLFVLMKGTFARPELYGEALVGLENVEFLGERILDEVTGPANSPGFPAVIVFRDQTLQLEDRQFWLVNSDGGRTGRVALEGSLDLAVLFGDAPGREIGAIRLRPESPGAIMPLTGFGLHAGLIVTDPDSEGGLRPLRLRISGRELELTGDVAMSQGSLDVGGLGRFATAQANKSGSADKSAPLIGPLIAYDVRLRVPDNFQITGPTGLRLALGAGELQLRGNALAPDLVGIIRAKSGRLDLLGKEFRLIEPATLTFSSLYSLDPLIQAKAEARIDTLDPTSLSGHRTVVITATVNSQFQALGDETGEGIVFASSDGLYSTPSQILALLAGFGGDRRDLGRGDDPLGTQMLRGLGNAAVSIPGQYIGQLFEEQGFQRFLIGSNIDGDLFVDAEYELSESFSLDYRQTFGVERDWEGGVRYQFRDNSFVRLGTNDEFDVIGAVEYRIPLGADNARKSLEAIAQQELALAEKNAALDAAAQAPRDPASAMDDDHVIEGIPGQPEVESEAVEDAEAEVESAKEQP